MPPGTVLPPNGALYVCPKAAAFRARTVSPKGGEGSSSRAATRASFAVSGETLALIDASGATNNTTSLPRRASDVQRYLVVSELMFHPAGNGLAEFIELFNTSSSVTLDLTDVRLPRACNSISPAAQ